MSKIVNRLDHGTRVIADVQVAITQLVWSDAGVSFEVHPVDTGADLTENGCFDQMPTDDQITDLLDPPSDRLACQGCGAVFSEDEGELYVDHVRDCDLVDGAGNPRRSES
jgi:hypothetical protein